MKKLGHFLLMCVIVCDQKNYFWISDSEYMNMTLIKFRRQESFVFIEWKCVNY